MLPDGDLSGHENYSPKAVFTVSNCILRLSIQSLITAIGFQVIRSDLFTLDWEQPDRSQKTCFRSDSTLIIDLVVQNN